MRKNIILLLFGLSTLSAYSQQAELISPIRHTSEIKSVKVSSSDHFLISVSDSEVLVWDVNQDKPIQRFNYSNGMENNPYYFGERFNRAVLSQNDQFMLTSETKSYSLWSLKTGERLFQVEKEKNHFYDSDNDLGFINNDGDFFVLISENFEIRSTQDGKLVQKLPVSRKAASIVTSTTDTPTKEPYLLSPDKNFIQVIDSSTGQTIRQIMAYTGQTLSVRFSPDGSKLAVGHNNNTVKIWDLKNGLPKFTLPCLRERFNQEFRGTPFDFSSDSKQIATRRDTSIQLWSSEDGQLLHHLIGNNELNLLMGNPAFSPDGQQVAAGDMWGAYLFSAETGNLLHATNDDNIMEIWDAQFSSNGKYLFMNSGEGYSYIIATNNMKVLQVDGIRRFLPDGDHYLDYAGNIVNIVQKKILSPLMANCKNCALASASADGKLLAMESNKNVGIISYPERKMIHKIKIGKNDRIVPNSLSANGRYLFILENDLSLEVIEFPSGEPVLKFKADGAIKDFDYNEVQQLLAVNHSGMTTLLSLDPNHKGELAKLIPLYTDDWLIITPDGHFDGTAVARSLIFFRRGNVTENEDALKKSYHKEGLLMQVLSQK